MRNGRTVLLVSHNMSAVNTLCDKGLLFSGGVLVKGGAASEVSASYMSSGTETTGVRTWKDADAMAGSEGIRLSLVRMRNAAGEVVGSFERSSSFSIEIEYELLRRFQEIRLGVDILTTDGIIVFCSHDSEDTSWRGKMREAGRYTSVCFIPQYLLNSGSYIFRVTSDVPNREVFLWIEDVLMFTIEDTGGGTAGYCDRPPGVVRPLLRWCVSRD